jgi:hypothetical protein
MNGFLRAGIAAGVWMTAGVFSHQAPAEVAAGESTVLDIDWQPTAAGAPSAPIALGVTRSEMEACRERMATFSRQLGDLMLSMDKLPPHLTELGWEAATRIPGMSDEQLAAGCDVLQSTSAQALDLEALRTEFESRSRARGCIGVEQYLGILGLRTALDAYNVGIQAICDYTSCPFTGPPVFEAPLCQITCIGVAAISISSEVISTRMDVADKCADIEHEEQMALLRANASVNIPAIWNKSSEVQQIIGEAAAKQADDEDLRGTDDVILQGFDGLSDRSANGIGPALTGLSAAVDDSRSAQVAFEEQAIRNRLENALVTGATYSRMIRPRAFDGLLEEVRELVAERIQAVAASGLPTEAALLAFRQGDTEFNQSAYTEALAAYRRAYLALAPDGQDGRFSR